MSSTTLLIAGLVAYVVATAYALVAVMLLRRERSAPGRLSPLRAFAFWWGALAANIFLGGSLYIAAAAGFTNFEAQFTYAILQRVLLAGSLVGLMYYLLFVLTGNGRLVPVVTFYTAYLFLVLLTFFQGQPQGVYVGDWRTDVQTTAEGSDMLGLLTFAALVLPPVIGSIAYFFLFFRFDPATERIQRLRVALVSWSLVLWWVVAVIAGQREALGQESFQLVNRFFGLLAALVILMAYRPPAWLRRRLGDPTPGAARSLAPLP